MKISGNNQYKRIEYTYAITALNVEEAIDYVNTYYDSVDLNFCPYGIGVFNLLGEIVDIISLDKTPTVAEMERRALYRQQQHIDALFVAAANNKTGYIMRMSLRNR